MKKTLTCLLVFFVVLNGNSQNYYSKILASQDQIDKGGITQFNNRNLIISDERCEEFSYHCGYILEVDDDGSISYTHELGEIDIYDSSFSSNEDRLTITGRKNFLSFWIIQLDKNLNEIKRKTHNVSTNLWIFDMVEYAGHFVVAAYDFGIGMGNYPRLYWLDTMNLEIQHAFIDDQLEGARFLGLAVDSENKLRVFNQRNDGQYILTFDENYTLLDEWESPEIGRFGYQGFEVISDDKIILGAQEERHIKCYDSNGQLSWQKDIASSLGVPDLYIRQFKQVSNGDIMICGSFRRNNMNHAFIYRISEDGEERFARIYSVEGWKGGLLKDFVEISEEEFLFSGTIRYNVATTSNTQNHHWVVKTDENGCVDEDCGGELVVNSFEVSKAGIKIYPNPASSYLELGGIEWGQFFQYSIFDISGRKVLHDNTNDNTIDISSLSNGAYFLNVSTDKGSFVEKLFKID